MAEPSFDQLRAFIEVVELGSFSAAARRLNVTQPAVSQQLRQLERRLGVRLIERVGRLARPTAAGAELLVHARRTKADLEAAVAAMARYAKGAGGRVHLGTGATACIYLLPPALRQLRRRFPDLEIVVSTGNTGDMLRAVEANSIDLALVALPAPGRMFDVAPVLEDEYVVVAPRGMSLPAKATPAALARLPLLLYEPGGNTRQLVDAWFARGRVAPKPVMELGSVEAIKELVAAGLGCAVLPRMAVRRREDRARFGLKSLEPRLYRTLALVTRRDKPRHKGLRETIRAVERHAARRGGLKAG